jgi:hypothetical protein
VPLPRNDVKRLERGARATRQVLVEVSSSTPEDEKLKVCHMLLHMQASGFHSC